MAAGGGEVKLAPFITYTFDRDRLTLTTSLNPG